MFTNKYSIFSINVKELITFYYIYFLNYKTFLKFKNLDISLNILIHPIQFWIDHISQRLDASRPDYVYIT